MPENLGEVRVQIEEEGAQDAADTIGDAMGEGEIDGGGGRTGGPGGETVGGLLGGISTKLAGILGFVGFLATLKPIQELLGGLQRLFSVAILPLVSLLTAFLRPIMTKLLRFITQLDFDNIVPSLIRNLRSLFNSLMTDISQEISSSVPGLNTGGARTALDTATAGPAGALSAPFGMSPGSINIALDWLSEQSNTSLSSNVADTNSEVTQRQGVGGQ